MGLTESSRIAEERNSNVKEWRNRELVLETTQSTARRYITPRSLNFEDEAGPSMPTSAKRFEISWSHTISIQQPTQGTVLKVLSHKDKSNGILVEELKRRKMIFKQIEPWETTNDEEVARKIQSDVGWGAEERTKFEELKKNKSQRLL
ncbi:hypothetical protein Tco_0797013 [Tanacetum coccineum]